MARAMATRFCMPPDISPGNLSPAPLRLTRSRQNSARRRRSLYESLLNMSSGNITFSSTDIESNSAALWNIMPISRRRRARSRFVMLMKLRPSYSTSPSVGSKSPTMHFISTVFPEPLWPIIRLVLPFSKVELMPLSTSLSSKDLCMFLISIMMGKWVRRAIG